eukprot:Skav210968  [mRNA]  locus=scaffold2129:115885:116223:+ [translate_table: standard]
MSCGNVGRRLDERSCTPVPCAGTNGWIALQPSTASVAERFWTFQRTAAAQPATTRAVQLFACWSQDARAVDSLRRKLQDTAPNILVHSDELQDGLVALEKWSAMGEVEKWRF